jgi:hypothetical protein
MSYLTLRTERRGPAAWIWINRLEVDNAIDETRFPDKRRPVWTDT